MIQPTFWNASSRILVNTRPRRGELVDAGHVVAAGTRKTRSGRAATV